MVQSSGLETPWVKDEWGRAENAFRENIDVLNRMIRDYNFEIPHLQLERFILDGKKEIGKIQKEQGI